MKDYPIPIFYFNPNPNESTFLDAKEITPQGISLCPVSHIPQQTGTIEFSLPNTDEVIKTNYVLEQDSFLKFVDLSPEDQNLILNFRRPHA